MCLNQESLSGINDPLWYAIIRKSRIIGLHDWTHPNIPWRATLRVRVGGINRCEIRDHGAVEEISIRVTRSFWVDTICFEFLAKMSL